MRVTNLLALLSVAESLFTIDEIFADDANGDGLVTWAEANETSTNKALFDAIDGANSNNASNGVIARSEASEWTAAQQKEAIWSMVPVISIVILYGAIFYRCAV